VLEVRRPHRASCENAVAEPRSEALDLPLDGFGAIDGRPGRDVAVRIARVLAFGRPPGVELALLHEQHEGPLGMLAAPDGGLRGRDLVQRATEVYGRGLQAAGVAPRDRPVQRPVELERAGTVAVAAEPTDVACGQDRFSDVGELRRAGVEENDASGRKVGEAADVSTRPQPAAQAPG